MLKQVTYEIVAQAKLIIEFYQGAVGSNDLIHLKKREAAQPDFNPDFNVIADIRDSILDIENVEFEVENYINFLKENGGFAGKRKIAIITNTSEHVIFAELFRTMKGDLPMEVKTMSTIEASFRWMGIAMDKIKAL